MVATPKSPFNIFRLSGDFTHLLSIIILIMKMKKSRSCNGISLKSQILFLVVYFCRYLDMFRVFTFARFISVYNFVFKIVFIASQALLVFWMKTKFSATYQPALDSFRIDFLMLACGILTLFMTRIGNVAGVLRIFEEYMWTFSIILESVAIFPQLFMLRKTGEAENITTHYLFCLGIYRGMYVLNWIYRYLVQGSKPDSVSLFFGLLQTVLFSDFFYVYYKRVLHGGKFSLLPH